MEQAKYDSNQLAIVTGTQPGTQRDTRNEFFRREVRLEPALAGWAGPGWAGRLSEWVAEWVLGSPAVEQAWLGDLSNGWLASLLIAALTGLIGRSAACSLAGLGWPPHMLLQNHAPSCWAAAGAPGSEHQAGSWAVPVLLCVCIA